MGKVSRRCGCARGSRARVFLANCPDELHRLLTDRPELWQPENLLLLQERFEVDPAHGIVRMEFLVAQLETERARRALPRER